MEQLTDSKSQQPKERHEMSPEAREQALRQALDEGNIDLAYLIAMRSGKDEQPKWFRRVYDLLLEQGNFLAAARFAEQNIIVNREKKSQGIKEGLINAHDFVASDVIRAAVRAYHEALNHPELTGIEGEGPETMSLTDAELIKEYFKLSDADVVV